MEHIIIFFHFYRVNFVPGNFETDLALQEVLLHSVQQPFILRTVSPGSWKPITQTKIMTILQLKHVASMVVYEVGRADPLAQPEPQILTV